MPEEDERGRFNPGAFSRLSPADLIYGTDEVTSGEDTDASGSEAEDGLPIGPRRPPVAGNTAPPPLPPSVEEAYRKKCIALKRRMNEVEEANDALRLRKERNLRGIRKLRLERAYLLEALAKRMGRNGGSIDGVQALYDEDSEGSSEAPPTPNEKPLRSKRSHRRPASSPPPMPIQQHRPLAPSAMHPTSAFEGPTRDPFRESQYQHTLPTPTNQHHIPIQFQPQPQLHPSTLPPNIAGANPISPTGPPPIRHRIQPPPSAFEEFLIKHILPNPDRFRHRTEDEAVAVAHEAWNDPNMEQIRASCEQNYERNMQAYAEEMRAYEIAREREVIEMQRGREMEGQTPTSRELPPPPLQQPKREDAGAGGFTSING